MSVNKNVGEHRNCYIRPSDLYIISALVCLAVMILFMMVSRGGFLGDIVWDARNPLFVDFNAHVERVRDGRNPYVADDWDARFPPLAYLFYRFLSCIIPKSVNDSNVTDWYHMFMIIILCMCVVCITMSVNSILKRSFIYTLIFILLFVASHTFAMAEIKAGNSAVYVLTLLILAFALRNSDSAVEREIALILIALAAGFKISPAIIGFLYIKEKRYKEAIRLVIYGLVAFFCPFTAFGGLEGIRIFLNITGQVSGAAIPRPETISGVFVEVFSVIMNNPELGLKVGRLISFGYMILCFWLLFTKRFSWKILWLITSLMVIFVNLSYPYTLQYFLIPLVFFVVETDETHDRMDYLYAVLFALVFLTYPFVKIDWPTATFITNYLWVYIMALVLITDLLSAKVRKTGINCSGKESE
ncbi:MAG: glycosyltransferase 87 family protein [Lachnospiraceae bacterium]|nr:glycosyltransferase 87 family protein [Lachnospiraceae bacterium]